MISLIIKKIFRVQQCVKFSFLIIILFYQSHCLAQTVKDSSIPFNHFSTEHGLSQNHFEAIIQDQKGYMWFGTWSGLLKFDGYNFTLFQYDPDTKNSFGGNFVYRLCEDHRGNIWIIDGDNNQLSRYNTHTLQFFSYAPDERNKFPIAPGAVNCMVCDHDGSMWIGTSDAGLCRYDPVTDHFINYSSDHLLPDTLCSKTILSLLVDRKGMLWIGTTHGINIYDRVHNHLQTFNPCKENNDQQDCQVSKMMEDHTGKIWITFPDPKGLLNFDPSNNTLKRYSHSNEQRNSLSSNYVNDIYEDHNHNIWIATYQGLNLYNQNTDDFKIFLADSKDDRALSSSKVMSIFEDRSGIIWIATNGGGLNTVYPDNKKFQVYQESYDDEFTTHYPVGLYNDHEGKIWINTFGAGLKRFDPLTKQFKVYKFDERKAKGHFYNACYCAFEDSYGTLWVGSTSEGLHALNKTDGSYRTYHSTSDNTDTTIYNQINCITEDHNKALWIGTTTGLKCFDLNTKKYSAFEKLFPDTNQLSGDNIQALYCDDEGVLWIAGSRSGLTSFNTKTGKVRVFKHDENDPHSLSRNFINCIYDNGIEKLWIGTEGGGLNELDKKSEQFISFTIKDGLPDNSVRGIEQDNLGNLWLSSTKGICRFTPPASPNQKAVCRNYNVSDGLPGDEFYYNTCTKGDDGTLYFGCNAGIVAFKPEELKDNSFIPPVVITDFSVFNKSIAPNDSSGILKLPADETKDIRLSYSQNNFSFMFTALSYVHPEKNQYAYRLKGFDKDWIYTDASKRFANYTNLGAGNYIFQVKASNNDGVWNETLTEIKIIITPPYWQTWWFKLMCLITFGLIFYVIVHTRLEKSRDIRRIRNKIASDLHDDLGATLSSISIMSEIANQQIKNQSPQTSPLLEKIGSSSRSMIENVNDMVWAINPRNDSFENIVKRMRAFASEILGAKDIDFHFDFDKNLLPSKMKMDTRRNFYLIYKEAVNNIAKYSGASNAFITILQREQNLKMTIRDDGKGFDLNLITKGNGLNNIEQRAEEMKAKLILQTDVGKGTMLQLEFKNQ
ncbi:MAG: hypothetical protein IPO83_16215 [Chitinophagaceae bacterium]|nr:hypothetical protein [Chitinophagaceae bacterium]